MDIVFLRSADERVLPLFSEHDDEMIAFLGEDQKYYTRYSEREDLACVWLARSGQAPAGCVAYRSKSDGVGEVKRLYVREAYRGRGIGKALLKKVERHAREQGCHTLFLDTRITLEPAVSIYRALGYRIVFQQGLYIRMEKKI